MQETALADPPVEARPSPAAGTGHRGPSTIVLAIGAALLGVALLFPFLLALWRDGGFTDSDDAMRMVEARDWLGGQGWFDLAAHRLDPPAGTPMHWSRVLDVPIGLLVLFFRLFVAPTVAETLTRLVLPFALLALLFAIVARTAEMLYGRAARLPALGALLLDGGALIQFQPGRIEQHGPQIVLLAGMVASALLALDPARACLAALAGALMALSLAISLENLPFIALLCAALIVPWIAGGRPMDRMIRRFALGLAAGLVVALAATVPPATWTASVCDAFGAPDFSAGLIGAAGLAMLATLSARLPTPMHRLAGAALVAAAALAFVAALYPACLHDPYAKVDPLVRELWLSKVREARPLMTLLHEMPMTGMLYALPVALGFCGCLLGTCLTEGLTRLRFAALAGLVGLGLGLAFWQIRVIPSVTPLAALGALPLVMAGRARLSRRRQDGLSGLAIFLALPFTSTAWALALPADAQDPARPDHACLAAPSFAPLAKLKGSAVAPVDAGSFLLAHTQLSVFAAPYHRDNDGNRFAFEVFLAPPDEAAQLLAARHVAYVLTCRGLKETERLAERAPNSLAAMLVEGRAPPWLVPMPLGPGPYTVYRVQLAKK